MKFMIEINAAQAQRVLEVVRQVALEPERQNNFSVPGYGYTNNMFCGNLVGYHIDKLVEPHKLAHRRQGGKNYLVYEGSRKLFHKSLYREFILGVLDVGYDDLESLRVVEYTTEDDRLRWYEEMGDFVRDRASLEDIRLLRTEGHRFEPPLRMEETLKAYHRKLEGASDPVLSAEFSAETLKALRVFL